MAQTQFTATACRNYRWTNTGYANWRTGYQSTDTTALSYVRHPYKSYLFFPSAAIAALCAANVVESISITLTPGYYAADERMDSWVHLWRIENCPTMPDDTLGNSMAGGIGTTSGTNGYFAEQLTPFILWKNDVTGAVIATGEAAQRLANSLSGGNPIGMFYRGQDEGTALYKPDGWNRNGGSVAPVITITHSPASSAFTLNKSSAESGETVTASISAYSGAYSHRITYALGGNSAFVDVPAGVSSVSFAIPHDWLSAIPNSLTGTATVALTTYQNGTAVGSAGASLTVTVPAAVVPTIAGFTAQRMDGSVPAAWGVYVQLKSKATLLLQGAAGAYGSTIQSVHISGGGYTAGGNADGSGNFQYTTGYLNTAGSNVFTATVTDSRGRTAQRTGSVTVEAYSAPKIEGASIFRCNAGGTAADEGTYISARARFTISPVGTRNTFSAVAYWKRSTAGTWTAGPGLSDNAPAVFGGGGAGISYSYDVRIDLTDAFQTVSFSGSVPVARAILSIKKGGKGVAVGKRAETDNCFEVAPDWTVKAGQIYSSGTFNQGSWNAPASGAITQLIDGSGAQHSVMVGRDGSGNRHYGIDLLDSTSSRVMRLYAGSQHIEIGPGGFSTSNFSTIIAAVRDALYPVGSIYLSVSAVNPGSLFGGSWVRWGQGRVPVSVNEAEGEWAGPEYTGGEKYHALTYNEMPSHNHRLKAWAYQTNANGTHYYGANQNFSNDNWDGGDHITYAGNSWGHNNMQPYISCYMWKRVG